MSKSVEPILRKKFKDKVRKTRGHNGIEYKVCCPFCIPADKRYKMYINPERFGGVYNCYRCGKSGTLRELLGELYDKPQMVEAAVKVEALPEDIQSPGYTIELSGLAVDHPGIEYLTKVRSRPFDPEELSTFFGVRYCNQGRIYGSAKLGFFYNTANTLIFPVWMFGKLVGWQSRLMYDPEALDDAQCAAFEYLKDEDGDWIRPPKYWTNPGFRKGRVLFNFDNARKYDYVVVTEGVFDAMAVGPSAVATFGKGIDESQARLLKTYWSTVIILLDPGDAGEETKKLIAELHRAVAVVVIDLKDFKDAGDAPRDEIWRQISATIEHRRLSVDAVMTRGSETTGHVDPNPPGQWTIIKGA